MDCTIYVGNNNLVDLIGLKNAATDSYENSADVSLRLIADDGSEIEGQTWPLTMNYVADSDGDYRATLSKDLVITHKQVITADITAVASGITGNWKTPCRVETRI